MGNSDLRLKHAYLGDWDVAALKVIVMLKGNIARIPVVVGGTVFLLKD